MKTITYWPAAERSLARLTPETAARIEEKIQRYAMTGEGDVKSMKGAPALRLRVGDWRVIFTEDMEIVDIINIGHRGAVYR